MAGLVRKETTRCRFLDNKLATAERRYQAAIQKHKTATAPIREKLNRNIAVLQALDKTIELAYKDVRCDAAGVVNAISGRYGHRGALTQFIQKALQDAAPNSVSVRALIDACLIKFSLKLATPEDRKSLKHSVRTALTLLKQRGIAEQVSTLGKGYPSCWRAVNRFGASQLRALAACAQYGDKKGALDDALSAYSASPTPTDPP